MLHLFIDLKVDSILPPPGYRQEKFSYYIDVPEIGKKFDIAEQDSFVAHLTPYTRTNGAEAPLINGNGCYFLPPMGTELKDSLRCKRYQNYQERLDYWADHYPDIEGIKQLQKLLQRDDFIQAIRQIKDCLKTKFLFFYDGNIITNADVIKDNWADFRLSQMDKISGICSLTGKKSDRLTETWNYAISSPRKGPGDKDATLSSFDKEYAQSGTRNKAQSGPVDWMEGDLLLRKIQWLLSYEKGSPRRYIEIDKRTYLLIFTSQGDLLNNEILVDSPDDFFINETTKLFISPWQGKEIKPLANHQVVYGVIIKFNGARLAFSDYWQGIPEDIQRNLERFFQPQKELGAIPIYHDFHTLIRIDLLAKCIESKGGGNENTLKRMKECLYKAAIWGRSIPLMYLSRVISRYAIDNQLNSSDRGTGQDWKVKLITIILENHNMNTDSPAFYLGKAIFWIQKGQAEAMDKDLDLTPVAKSLSLLLKVPSQVVPTIVERWIKIYIPQLTENKRNIFYQKMVTDNLALADIPNTFTPYEQGQFIKGMFMARKEAFTKKSADPETKTEEQV